ncbi:MAG TPA: 2-amino-4-hydroxy-6-hydroxymethyldihydropteridine diphosphokinase [Leptospiraceae bacterium]|nr:2-amino-4-hydroxy-6-hydroxymethyldihydropteridine diphosphokinase [Leptospirales bacterium]HMU81994.1 2-amino-4-hydroxy-6-hydroxymethyldihydropteridine diphosphokinase [Leptospiraceae bacterium]HMW60292.1 2-amino-4-hydroxy-6-hydroxymethyldihydropteridine diphosphokinase [Leptospiraceae bacterium]HMX56410.1 2-amino-4-hydroxy-6-hydroxymethyldihydropteridine diphosphokinase [Leptospiraceae bacterium]HMY44806.1 2-amino-4-hydroxy-6-hydroxymethyldihydropteridine diphosphokinase [Leptospiraceae bac
MIAYLALGSNLGNREAYLDRARHNLGKSGIKILRDSENLDNPPLIVEDQPAFLNAILEVETSLEPLALLQNCKQVEEDTGRKQTYRYGPREIDIDILAGTCGGFSSDRLTLPHPGLLDRPYLRTLLERLELTPENLLELKKNHGFARRE